MIPHRRTLALAALAATLSVAALASGCLGGDADRAGYQTHAVAEWKERFEATPGAFLLDVRTPEEFAQGHLGNATLIPYTDLRARASELPVDKDAPIFVYCRSGNRSGVASETLVNLGYTNVHNMAGGILDWTAAGYPVEA